MVEARPMPVLRERRPLTARQRAWRIAIWLLLVAGALLVSLPFIYMVVSSVETNEQIGALTPQFIPNPIQWDNYATVWQQLPVGRFFVNSLIVAGAITVGQVITASMAAYAFSRLRFPGRSLLFAGYLATLIIPFQVTLIPNYILIHYLGWNNTYQGLIAPFISSVFSTFLLRQFFLGIPNDLEEAALLDGAGHWIIYSRVIMPLARPALAAVVIFAFLGSWNNFLWPLVVIDSESLKTLPLGIVEFEGEYTIQWNLLMAGASLSLLPVLAVYLAAQRWIVEGITLTGQGGR
ncbi:MAG TPA: carbohydrate ABC transporter permease [Chloroflexota bacterium]|nr:carbohydrate ABC transporter permease [Chloroflexota bacterium]